MEINVSQLLREPIGSTREYEIDEVTDTGNGNENAVRGEVRLLRTQRSILAECRLRTTVELTCSRCLSPFRLGLNVKFAEEYVPTVDVVSGASVPVPDEPGIFTIDEHHILDLSEAVRQYALLAVPMKPLCREECAGLCPGCGRNLNHGPCECPHKDIDPRWSELTKLFESSFNSNKRTE